MSQMIVEVPLLNGKLIELEGDNCKLWISCGLPDYEGPIDGLLGDYPEVFQELLERGIIKPA